MRRIASWLQRHCAKAYSEVSTRMAVQSNKITYIPWNELISFNTSRNTFIVSKADKPTIDYVVNSLSVFSSKHESKTRESIRESSQPFYEKINKANSVQSSVRLGKKTISRNHPDYFDLLFLNHILGGYFGSRLMKNIREEKGLTYGIQSSINSLMNESFMVIGADVNKENESLIFREIEWSR